MDVQDRQVRIHGYDPDYNEIERVVNDLDRHGQPIDPISKDGMERERRKQIGLFRIQTIDIGGDGSSLTYLFRSDYLAEWFDRYTLEPQFRNPQQVPAVDELKVAATVPVLQRRVTKGQFWFVLLQATLEWKTYKHPSFNPRLLWDYYPASIKNMFSRLDPVARQYALAEDRERMLANRPSIVTPGRLAQRSGQVERALRRYDYGNVLGAFMEQKFNAPVLPPLPPSPRSGGVILTPEQVRRNQVAARQEQLQRSSRLQRAYSASGSSALGTPLDRHRSTNMAAQEEARLDLLRKQRLRALQRRKAQSAKKTTVKKIAKKKPALKPKPKPKRKAV